MKQVFRKHCAVIPWNSEGILSITSEKTVSSKVRWDGIAADNRYFYIDIHNKFKYTLD